MNKITLQDIPTKSWEESLRYLNANTDTIAKELKRLRRADRRHGFAIVGLCAMTIIFNKAIVDLEENYKELKEKLEAQEKTE